ncbi:MAG: DEAD/DEAH box helicase [Alphaproteobacteria bacterium]|nr:DEAD/DEAH box helicase [Alphaproteobacteria bacterium]
MLHCIWLFRPIRLKSARRSRKSRVPLSFDTTPTALARALAERHYHQATPVQAAVLEEDAEGRDLLVSAQTGSGKTIAYGLAVADTLLDGADTMGPAGAPLALVVAPTRELALQVQRELSWLYRYAGARVVSCVGGMDPGRERRELSAGAHIVVGTPGRLRDHLERRALNVSSLKAAVLDEADEMLDMGFREDLQFILETTPPERRTLLFSATLPKPILHLATHYQRDALRIATAGETRGHADIEYRAIRIAPAKVEAAVINLLRALDAPGALVFCNTRNAVRHMESMLLERGFAVVALSGELSQHERNHALQALRDGRARVCVATDVAARGIDLPNLDLVIHAELPNDAEVLQHRSGRTGRAGRKGISVLLVPPSRRRRAEEMLGRAKVQAVWGNAPTPEDIRKLDQERLLQSALLTEPAGEDDLTLADALLARSDARAVAAAFVKMCRARLPAPEEIDNSPQDERPRRHEKNDRHPRERGKEHPSRDQQRRANPPRERGPAPATMADGVWFRLNVGRERKADPKWLLPEICRQGEITKKDVGAIRVFDTETLFQVGAQVAEKFASLVGERKKGGIRILPAPDQSGESRARPAAPAAEDVAAPESARKEGGFHQRKFDNRKAGDQKPDGPKFGDKKKFGGKKFAKKRFDKSKPGSYPPKRQKPSA